MDLLKNVIELFDFKCPVRINVVKSSKNVNLKARFKFINNCPTFIVSERKTSNGHFKLIYESIELYFFLSSLKQF